MKFNQLRDFVAVAEAGSLRGAARKLGLAQPAITRSIQELEHSLGSQLFIREARGVRLTSIGMDFRKRAVSILNEIRRAQEAVSQQQDSVEGELVVGLSVATHLVLLGEIIPAFQRRYPKVRLRIIEGFLPTLEADLLLGDVDLYFGPVSAEYKLADLQVTILFNNERVVVGRHGHPMSDARTLADLTSAAWLATSVTHDANDEFSTAFVQRGLPAPVPAARCQSALSILTLMLNSDLLAMMPIQWVKSPMLKGWLQQINLNDTFPAPPIAMVSKTGLGPTPAGEYFAHLAQRAALGLWAE